MTWFGFAPKMKSVADDFDGKLGMEYRPRLALGTDSRVARVLLEREPAGTIIEHFSLVKDGDVCVSFLWREKLYGIRATTRDQVQSARRLLAAKLSKMRGA